MSDSVKQAMDPENKAMLKKYLSMGLGAAVLSAGIGAVVRNNRAKKAREKAIDATKATNAIVVPIRKDKFVEGLPTPAELAASRGETPGGGQVQPPESVADSMSPEDIEARKKELLRGRKFDFFGSTKKAQAKKDDGEQGDDEEKGKKGIPRASDSKKESNGNKEPRILPPRNAAGQFTSPTDPVAVPDQEKYAEWDWLESGKNLFLHPFNTLGGAWDSATTRPLYITAGGIGSIFLASMLVDKVNEIRAKKAKGDAEVARNEYVRLLQSNEKSAAEQGYRDTENPISAAGTMLGASFVVPMALSAIIANKIMARRKAEKDKKKEMSDSYPDEPIILYKTSSDKEIELTPESALALIMVKRAMFASFEIADLEKEAAWGGDWIFRNVNGGLGEFAQSVKDTASDIGNAAKLWNAIELDENGRLTDKSYEALAGDEYDEALYNLANGWINGSKSKIPGLMADKMKAIAADPRTYDLFANKFANKEGRFYKKRWGALQDAAIDRELGNTFGKTGFRGWLKGIISWLVKNTGLGGWMMRRGLKGRLGTQPQQQQNAGAGNPAPAPTATTPTATTTSTPTTTATQTTTTAQQ